MFSITNLPKYTKYTRPNKNQRHQKAVRKHKVKTFIKAIVAAWEDFCTTSSFVGFRYVYHKNRTYFDVLFWVLLMSVLMCCSITFVWVFLDRYHSLSTKAIIRTQHYLSSRTIFPAITACISGRISKSRINSFIEEYINSNEDLKQSVNITSFVKIFTLGDNADSITLSNAGRVFSSYNLTMRDMLKMTTENCEEIFIICRWAGKIIPCKQIFKRTMAVGGFCCSFNYPIPPDRMQYKKWLRTNTYGLNGGLSFAFTLPNDNYFYKLSYGNTLRVLIHPPHAIPTFNQNDILIEKSMETSIEINNVYNTADLKVKNLPIEERDCLFSTEKTLKDFGRYSTDNCLLQCRIDRVMNNCGCISFYYPSNDSDVCGTEKFPCTYRSKEVGAKQGDKRVYTQVGDCDCPDDCVIVKQYTKINSWDFSTTNYSVDDFYDKVADDQGIAHISFAKSTTMRLYRKLSFDEIQLASNIGGIIALFLGCSFVSVIEIIYFLTIRMLKFYYIYNGI